jgi:hypothetical protein
VLVRGDTIFLNLIDKITAAEAEAAAGIADPAATEEGELEELRGRRYRRVLV